MLVFFWLHGLQGSVLQHVAKLLTGFYALFGGFGHEAIRTRVDQAVLVLLCDVFQVVELVAVYYGARRVEELGHGDLLHVLPVSLLGPGAYSCGRARMRSRLIILLAMCRVLLLLVGLGGALRRL